MPIRPGVEVVNHLITKWLEELKLVAQEEVVVSADFERGEVLNKFGNQLVIRKISAIPGTILGASGDPTALTATNNVETTATASPTFAYGFTEIGISALTRTGAWPDKNRYFDAYRRQISAGVKVVRDVTAGQLAAQLSNTRGSAADNFSKALLLDAITVLAGSSKNHFTINRETGEAQRQMRFLKYHTNQIKHILNVQELTAALYRGDKQNPNVDGVVWDGYGLKLSDSGNIYITGGAAYNLLHMPSSHVMAFNQEFMFLNVQEFQAAFRIIGFEEFGAAEQFDEDAVAILTSASG